MLLRTLRRLIVHMLIGSDYWPFLIRTSAYFSQKKQLSIVSICISKGEM